MSTASILIMSSITSVVARISWRVSVGWWGFYDSSFSWTFWEEPLQVLPLWLLWETDFFELWLSGLKYCQLSQTVLSQEYSQTNLASCMIQDSNKVFTQIVGTYVSGKNHSLTSKYNATSSGWIAVSWQGGLASLYSQCFYHASQRSLSLLLVSPSLLWMQAWEWGLV